MLLGDAATGMAGITEQLTTGITSSTLFSTIGEIMPFVIVMLGFSVGFYVFRRVIKKASKLKAGV